MKGVQGLIKFIEKEREDHRKEKEDLEDVIKKLKNEAQGYK